MINAIQPIKLNLLELRNKGIKMLVKITSILTEYRIKYWIEYGTLLGAERNGRLIPWDNEIDIGVFYTDFIQEDRNFYKSLTQNNFSFESEPDRIKIRKKGWDLGYFVIDLHLYKVKQGRATISYALQEQNFFSKLFNKIYSVIMLFDNDKKMICGYDKIIKLLIFSNKDYIRSLPDSVLFSKGRFNHENSFIIRSEGKEYISTPLKNNDSFIRKVSIAFLEILPNFMISIFIHIIRKIKIPIKYSSLEMRFPQEYFEKFKKIKLENKYFFAPFKTHEYLELVYDKDWKYPKIKWKRDQMKVICPADDKKE